MSNARKLQTEIDRVMKKVDEGVELFDEIWEKVYSAEQQNQKEKYEMDLKKEIKKLQRLRDQIKTWIGGSDVKDKEPLMDARRLIETKMEQFKICEKETKTKTYSKEGLARQERLDPAEQAKQDTTTWISEVIDNLQEKVDEYEVEIEKLSSGRGKKTNKHVIEEYNHYISNHKFHLNKLEGIMRLVNNDVLDVEVVDPIKEDLDYYLESNEDEDFQQAYDEEYFYEALGLDDLAVVNVDRVTQVEAAKKETDSVSATSKGSKDRKKPKNAASSVIPLTIGRARVASTSSKGSKGARDSDSDHERTPSKSRTGPTPTTIPAARPVTAPAPAPGTSMAEILKRETEQQEKERQKAEQLRQQQQQQQLAAQQLAAQQQRQQQEAQLRQQQQQQEALRQQQQREEAAAKQKALQLQQQQQEALRQQQQQEALKRQQAQQQAQQQQQAQAAPQPGQQEAMASKQQQLLPQSNHSSGGSGTVPGLDLLLGGLSLGGGAAGGGVDLTNNNANNGGATADGAPYLSALSESFATMPSSAENERSRSYTPQNPYPTPTSYPATPSPIFDNPQIFEKLGTDCLFFIFYYAQGTYQQYLAARELKKQSWRFHKKYMTWFQRHEEPKVTTDEYEQGTYVYFDYETGWCTRIKTDFRFEYSFLEDSLQ